MFVGGCVYENAALTFPKKKLYNFTLHKFNHQNVICNKCFWKALFYQWLLWWELIRWWFFICVPLPILAPFHLAAEVSKHSQREITHKTCDRVLWVHGFRSLHIWMGCFSWVYNVTSLVNMIHLSLCLTDSFWSWSIYFLPWTQQRHIIHWHWTWGLLKHSRISILLSLRATITLCFNKPAERSA